MTKTTTMTMKPQTVTETKITNHPPPVSLTHKPTNPTNATPITMEQCKELMQVKWLFFFS